MKENILILSILIACAFSAGAMVAGGLLPPGALYAVIGGAVLVAVMALFVGAVLGVVWLFKRHETPQQADPWRTYWPYPERPTWTPVEHIPEGYRITHRPVGGHTDPWPTLEPAEDRRRELPIQNGGLIQWKK